MRRIPASLLLLCCTLAAPVARGGAGVLVNQFGKPVPGAELNGHYLLVYFGYTSCPDICPTSLTVISAVLKRLGPDTGLRALFVTVDPKRDTVPAMRAYLRHFNSHIIGLTGSPEDLAGAAARFGVAVHPGAANGTIEHGAFIYLVGPDGRVLQTFHPEQSAADIYKAVQTALTR